MKRLFSEGKEARDALFTGKDDVTVPILRSLRVLRPNRYKAVLMPSLYGPEVFFLRESGVPGRNIFAVERDPQVWSVLVKPRKDLWHLKEIKTSPTPMALHQAVEHIPFDNINLVYLDLFGQPGITHYKALFRLFRLYNMAPGSTLMLTTGRNRGEVFSCNLNKRLTTDTASQAYIEAALREAEHRRYDKIRTHEYKSNRIRFSITEVTF